MIMYDRTTVYNVLVYLHTDNCHDLVFHGTEDAKALK